jgi:hypothetical protein
LVNLNRNNSFKREPGFGEADYLLHVDGQAVAVVEAKKEGSALTGFEGQTANTARGFLTLCLPPRTKFPAGGSSPMTITLKSALHIVDASG